MGSSRPRARSCGFQTRPRSELYAWGTSWFSLVPRFSHVQPFWRSTEYKFQIRVDRRRLEEAFGRLHAPLGGVQAIVFQQANGLSSREMAAFAIRRTHLESRDDLEVAFQLGFG